MNKKLLYLLLAFISILTVAMMHYYHGSFAYDSFGYMQNAHYIMGHDTTISPYRIGLVPFFIAPFVSNIFILYLYYSVITFCSLLMIVKIVELFKPKNQEYILFFVVPSYTTYVLTTVLQEAFAMLFVSLAIYYLLKKKYVVAMLMITVCTLARPAMFAFLPGFILAVLFHKYIFNEIDRNFSLDSLYVSFKKNFLRLFFYGLFCMLIFVIIFYGYFILNSNFFVDPLISYKWLSSNSDIDWKFVIGYPLLWISLFGIMFSPVIVFCFYKIYQFDKRWFFFLILMFFPYLFLLWYKAHIRYCIFLVIPIMLGFSLIEISSFKKYTKIIIFLLFAFSTLYVYGPITYYFEPGLNRRVMGINYKPFIYFDSENKSEQYKYFCTLKNKKEYTEADKVILTKRAYILDFLNKYVCK